ncbi:MAG: aconitate hydratase [Treponema sp. GWB1_62_6]|nr:MAG: aconitate hydratase [Treponema sp. GWA1_62_8]OHE63488.1 MAG: aconitate hydratase [Treponema sp. GWC1_61_84]OHE66145.1 MAG: aconitate hydratase [Treponema sp. GWB1_62_6]
MKGTITERLLKDHLLEGQLVPGKEIGIRIDQTLTQDATGTMVYLEFESMGLKRVKVELAVSYVDHNIIQTDFKNADDHRFLQSAAAKYGVILSPPGNGVSHHLHRQRFGVPGKTLIGSDSHSTTGGCLCMLAMGSGGIEVAMAMAGEPYYLNTPTVWGVRVAGGFQPYVSGKDLILTLLGKYSAKSGIGKVMEFHGPGLANLDMAARATIANMSVDMGFTACVFPSDNITKAYLRQLGRAGDFKEILTGTAPDYDELIELKLDEIEPMVACPSNPDNVKPARELGDVPVHQVIIGSSCNGDFRDYMIAAKMVEGKLRHPQVSFEINPGSRETLDNVMAAGGIRTLIESGARVHEPGCLGCIGMGQAPASGTNSLRTFPRNFKGRSGTLDDSVYLCSPETAAASALTGKITDPRTSGKYPKIVFPKEYLHNTKWFLQPSSDPDSVEIVKGPNIKEFPVFGGLSDTITGEVLLKVGDDISTDIIMPAGNRVLPFRSNIPAISDFVFDMLDKDFAKRAREKGGGVIVGGENYGQGSSREHAALAPRYLGVTAKLVKSIARIHKANLINFGIVPLTFKNPADYDAIEQGAVIAIPGIRKLIADGAEEIPVEIGGKKIVALLDVSDRHRKILLAGGILNMTKEK